MDARAHPQLTFGDVTEAGSMTTSKLAKLLDAVVGEYDPMKEEPVNSSVLHVLAAVSPGKSPFKNTCCDDRIRLARPRNGVLLSDFPATDSNNDVFTHIFVE
jgi:hypothetical protein